MSPNRWYAQNARPLLDMRQHGHRPAGQVAVTTFEGRFDPSLYVITVRDGAQLERLDWRMLADLTVTVWSNKATPLTRVIRLCTDIASSMPRGLGLAFEDETTTVHTVDLGSGHHRQPMPEHNIPPEHSFLWAPINTGGTQLSRRLTRAMKGAQPQGVTRWK